MKKEQALVMTPAWRVFGSTTRVTRFSSDNANLVASVAASGVLVAASGVVCDSSLFSLEITVSKKLLTSGGARTKSSMSLIKQVAPVGQQHEAFGLQGRVVDVVHVGQAHPCYKSRTAEYPLDVSVSLGLYTWGILGLGFRRCNSGYVYNVCNFCQKICGTVLKE